MKFAVALLVATCLVSTSLATFDLGVTTCLTYMRLLQFISGIERGLVQNAVQKLIPCSKTCSATNGNVCKVVVSDNYGQGITATFNLCSCGTGQTCTLNTANFCATATSAVARKICKMSSDGPLYSCSKCANVQVYTCNCAPTTTTTTTTLAPATTTTPAPATTTTPAPTTTTTTPAPATEPPTDANTGDVTTPGSFTTPPNTPPPA